MELSDNDLLTMHKCCQLVQFTGMLAMMGKPISVDVFQQAISDADLDYITLLDDKIRAEQAQRSLR